MAVDHEVRILEPVDAVLGAEQPLEVELHAARLCARGGVEDLAGGGEKAGPVHAEAFGRAQQD